MEVKEFELEPIPREIDLIKPNDEIYLSVTIGNGQIGGNKVSIEDDLIVKGDLTQPTYLGSSDELAGGLIELETNVLDVNSFTNVCVITTTFLNKNNDILFTKIDKGEAPQNGIASFLGQYIFKSILMFFLLVSSITFSQNEKLEDFSELETPTSPGFILFDQTPSSIEKPTTPQGLGLSLLGFSQNGGAIEVAPLWLSTHPNLTAKRLREKKSPILENLGISIASVETDSLLNFSLGLRTKLFQTYGNSIEQKLNNIEAQLINEISKGNGSWDLTKIEKLRKEYVELTEKPVFSIDLAAAVGASSISKSFSDLEYSRWATWLSFNFRPKGDNFYFTLVSRYKNVEVVNDENNLFDLGSRFNWDISKFSISCEYLHRLNLTSEEYDDFRIAAIGSYKVSSQFYLTTTFGKNFNDVDNIIALAGINFGFSNKKVKAY